MTGVEPSDAELTALIDGELDDDAARRCEAAIATDASVRARFEALSAARAPLDAVFAAMLDAAPSEKLSRYAVAAEAPKPRRTLAWREFAAGLIAGAFVSGALALALTRLGADDDDWRSAVVDYMRLYTPKTFAMPTPERAVAEAELAAAGGDVGVALTPDAVALPGLTFKVAIRLAYEGAPLIEIAYVDAANAPVLFCLTTMREPDAKPHVESRDGYALASWAHGGHGYLTIGRLDPSAALAMAETLSRRF